MDVDLLRPGTVPISADTHLWFEFLLNPRLLKKHLENPTSDPTPAELIIKLLSMACSRVSTQDLVPGPVVFGDGEPAAPPVLLLLGGPGADNLPTNRRSRALKILALKVAAFLRWDLSVLETNLPLRLQSMLLRELLAEMGGVPNCGGGGDTLFLPPPDWNPAAVPAYLASAIALYHRWVIRSYSSCSLNTKINAKQNGIFQHQVPVVPDWAPVDITEAESKHSVKILQTLVDTCPPLVTLPFECFVPLIDGVTKVEHRWYLSQPLSKVEFRCQVLMDLSNYFIYREMYSQARACLQECMREFRAWKKEQAFKLGGGAEGDYCKVTQEVIIGSCIAVGILPIRYRPSLVQQFHTSMTGQYIGIDRVLDQDNVCREIPLLYRDGLELDVASEAASGKLTAHRDGIVQIQASNLVRRALAGHPWHRPKITPLAIHKALVPVMSKASDLEKNRLKNFLLEMLGSSDFVFREQLLEQLSVRFLLSEMEIQEIQEMEYIIQFPQLIATEVEYLPIFNSRVSGATTSMERKLISLYDAQLIKESVMKLLSANPILEEEIINRDLDVPPFIYNMIKSLNGGCAKRFYIFSLMTKSYELVKLRNFDMARSFLRFAYNEISQEFGSTSKTSSKMNRLILQEILLIDIEQFHTEWPIKNIDWQGMTHKCIGVLHKSDVRRANLREQCALALLNSGQWHSLVSNAQCNSNNSDLIIDLYTSLAVMCLEVNKYNKKISTEAWDKVLPMFMNNQKRHWEELCKVPSALCSVMELNVLAVIISLLTNLHNVLNSQPSLDLYVYSSYLWPTTIKNSNQYDIEYVSEILFEILDHALKHYPYNISWLKLHGDLHFCNNNFGDALKFYLKAAIAGTDYFSRPITRNVIEEHIYKRMIKCCSQLQCHAQAAVLCQFLEEVDYTIAFKSLTESTCGDAMDSYFDCIWDITILEFLINLYSKRGEHSRKQKVIAIIGLLELNSNNNDEIKREAENIRKGKFLRSMAQQYIC